MSVAEARTAGRCSARLTEGASHVGSRRLQPASFGDQIDRLYRGARGMCGSAEQAEELVQETIARVRRTRLRFRHSDPDIGHLLRALLKTFAAQARVAEDGLDARLHRSDAYRAIASLPDDSRDVLIAVDLMGLSYGEAARALRVREATITSRLHLGRQRVADTLR